MKVSRKVLAGVLVAIMVASVAIPAFAAVSNELNFGGDAPAPDPFHDEDTLTKDHNMSWGSSDSVALDYENDNGDRVSADASLNTSYDNQYRITASHIDDPDWAEFPRKGSDTEGDNTASALDASEWSKSGQNSSQLSVSDVETAEGVAAVQIGTDGTMGSGDTATATYNNFTVSSDESKRYLTVVLDVTTLDTGATVWVNVTDADGDYKAAQIDTGANAGNNDVIANSTGDGQVLQVQLADLTTEGSGSGTWNDIESVDVEVENGDATVEVAYLDLEKKGEIAFGTKKANTDSDDALEEVDIVEPRGEYKVHDLGTLDSSLDNAVVRDMKVKGVHWRASDLTDSSDYQVTFEDASDYPSFDKVLDVYYRVEVPAAIDLSHSGLEFRHQTQWPGDRYIVVETKEGVGDTEFDDVSNWNDQTSSFSAQDKNVTLDSTVSSGTEYAVHMKLKLTQSEADAMQSTGGQASSGGGGLFASSGGGGLVGFLTSLPGMLVVAGLGIVQKIRGGIPFNWF